MPGMASMASPTSHLVHADPKTRLTAHASAVSGGGHGCLRSSDASEACRWRLVWIRWPRQRQVYSLFARYLSLGRRMRSHRQEPALLFANECPRTAAVQALHAGDGYLARGVPVRYLPTLHCLAILLVRVSVLIPASPWWALDHKHWAACAVDSTNAGCVCEVRVQVRAGACEWQGAESVAISVSCPFS